MPRISQFFGIMIYMYYNDHLPPHFHAKHAEYEALIRIDTLAILKGELPQQEKAPFSNGLPCIVRNLKLIGSLPRKDYHSDPLLQWSDREVTR